MNCRLSLIIATACFAAGWLLAGPAAPRSGPGKEKPARLTGIHLPPGSSGFPDTSASGLFSSAGGTFAELEKRDVVMARMRPEDWARLWAELMPRGLHRSIIDSWPEADPAGALKAALAATDDPSLVDQDRYDLEYLGRRALDELFRRDPEAALRGVEQWLVKYGRYPGLGCLHLLVDGSDGSKAALGTFLVKAGAGNLDIGNSGAGFQVLEALAGSKFSGVETLRANVVYSTMQTDPAGTADWILRQSGGGPIPPAIMERAIQGLRAADFSRLQPGRETTEALGRLLEAAPPDVVDQEAAGYALRRASFDPDGAWQWALEHVPEARRKEVLEKLEPLREKGKSGG